MDLVETFALVLMIFSLIGAAGLGVWALIRFINNKWARNKEGFYVSQRINSEAEERFYHFLLLIFKNHQDTLKGYKLLGQVSLPRVVDIAEDKFSWGEFNKIGNKSVDFVFADRVSGKAKLVIELDDKTHELEHRRRRDEFVDKVLANAGIPILHIKVQRRYNEPDVYDLISSMLKP